MAEPHHEAGIIFEEVQKWKTQQKGRGREGRKQWNSLKITKKKN